MPEGIEEQNGWCVNVMRLLPSNKVCGMASFVNASPLHGTVEVGYVAHGLEMAQSLASTEMYYLLAKHVFDNGYRRYVWKCVSNNVPSQETQLDWVSNLRDLSTHRIRWNKENRDTIGIPCWIVNGRNDVQSLKPGCLETILILVESK